MAILGPISYSLAALLFFALLVLVVIGWRRRRQSGYLILACFFSMAWAVAAAVGSVAPRLNIDYLFVLEVLRDAAWLQFLIAVLDGAERGLVSGRLRLAAWSVPALILAAGLFPDVSGMPARELMVPAAILLSLFGLLLVEQVYRNSDPLARRPIAFLTIAVGGIFAYDLFLYSSALLTSSIDAGIWASRGLANAFVVPLLAVAARRNRDWPVQMFVSRQAVSFSATLFGAGVYLLLMSLAGYYIKSYGGDWGSLAQSLFFFATVVLLAFILLSENIRRQIRVFIAKHFYENKYDYREEWLRLAQTLYASHEDWSLYERSIRALAQIMRAESGVLWLRAEGEDRTIHPVATWNVPLQRDLIEAADSRLVTFLEVKHWVIDSDENQKDPDIYGGLTLSDWLAEGRSIIVPLLLDQELLGFVVLQDVPAGPRLTYEDTDLLKITGREVAGNIAQQQASEKLAEGRQFQAYSRLTAFLMHDLKNLVAQQSLVVKNAAKHKGNPEFFDDVIATIANSVERMQRLIEQLKERERKEKRGVNYLGDSLRQIAASLGARQPAPLLELPPEDVAVLADSQRLAAIFGHTIRNAQDACGEGDSVKIVLSVKENSAVVAIADTGCGMDEAFIRERLFKPFESTKGADGMGIGAYQVREYVRELGGKLDVKSRPKQGTTVTIFLPLVKSE